MAAVWLGGIAVNLLTTGHYFDVAVRDVTMAIAAFTLARLTEAGASAAARNRVETRSLLGNRKSDQGVRVLALDLCGSFQNEMIISI